MSVVNYGLLHENITLAYSVFFGDRSSALSLTVGFFRTFGFRPILVGFQLVKRNTLHNALVLSGLQKTKYRKGIFFLWLSSLNLTDKPYNGGSQEIME